jgi:polyisoprenoid-binding protein YceI
MKTLGLALFAVMAAVAFVAAANYLIDHLAWSLSGVLQ